MAEVAAVVVAAAVRERTYLRVGGAFHLHRDTLDLLLICELQVTIACR
eukprot:SAG25_NODE_4564_length_789_cov_1.462319_2_plen_47_part_01